MGERCFATSVTVDQLVPGCRADIVAQREAKAGQAFVVADGRRGSIGRHIRHGLPLLPMRLSSPASNREMLVR
jgi:hypothetical protein